MQPFCLNFKEENLIFCRAPGSAIACCKLDENKHVC